MFSPWRLFGPEGEIWLAHRACKGVVTCECARVKGLTWRLEFPAKSPTWPTEVWCGTEFFARGKLAGSKGLLGTVTEWRVETGNEPLVVTSTLSLPPWTVRFHTEGATLALARMGCMKLGMVCRRRFVAWGEFFVLAVMRDIHGPHEKWN
jgi:hypothetical protein